MKITLFAQGVWIDTIEHPEEGKYIFYLHGVDIMHDTKEVVSAPPIKAYYYTHDKSRIPRLKNDLGSYILYDIQIHMRAYPYKSVGLKESLVKGIPKGTKICKWYYFIENIVRFDGREDELRSNRIEDYMYETATQTHAIKTK